MDKIKYVMQEFIGIGIKIINNKYGTKRLNIAIEI